MESQWTVRCNRYIVFLINATKHVKPWPHRMPASASPLTPASMLENGYDTDSWCGLYRYKLGAITSVKANDGCFEWFIQVDEENHTKNIEGPEITKCVK